MFVNDGLSTFDATGVFITLNYASQPVDHIINVVTITTSDGLTKDRASPPKAIHQTSMPILVSAIIYFMTSQELKTPHLPTTTPKFSRTSGCVNWRTIDYKTRSGETIYKQTISSLYSESEGNFALTSEGLIQFVELINGDAKSYGWEIFDVPISNTGFTT